MATQDSFSQGVEALARAFAAGEEPATPLFSRCRATLLAMIGDRFPSLADPAAAVDEALMQFWRKADDQAIDFSSNPAGYLRTIANNAAKKAIAAQIARHQAEQDISEPERVDDFMEIEAIGYRSDIAAALTRASADGEAELVETVIECYRVLEESGRMNKAEVARRLGVRSQTIANRLSAFAARYFPTS